MRPIDCVSQISLMFMIINIMPFCRRPGEGSVEDDMDIAKLSLNWQLMEKYLHQYVPNNQSYLLPYGPRFVNTFQHDAEMNGLTLRSPYGPR